MSRSINDMASELLNINSANNPINYKWDSDIFREITYFEDGHNRLKNAICKIGYKASIGLAASLFELIYCRLDGSAEITKEMGQKIKYKINATWMAAMDPLLSEILDYNLDERNDGNVFGPIWIVLVAIKQLSNRFVRRSYFIHSPVVGIALLAEHIFPNKNLFHEWFSQVLEKSAKMYPCTYTYAEIDRNAEYDCSGESPMLREFYFGSDDTWSIETVRQRVREYIKSDGAHNPYLRLRK